jgi:hypothetical protein
MGSFVDHVVICDACREPDRPSSMGQTLRMSLIVFVDGRYNRPEHTC